MCLSFRVQRKQQNDNLKTVDPNRNNEMKLVCPHLLRASPVDFEFVLWNCNTMVCRSIRSFWRFFSSGDLLYTKLCENLCVHKCMIHNNHSVRPQNWTKTPIISFETTCNKFILHPLSIYIKYIVATTCLT